MWSLRVWNQACNGACILSKVRTSLANKSVFMALTMELELWRRTTFHFLLLSKSCVLPWWKKIVSVSMQKITHRIVVVLSTVALSVSRFETSSEPLTCCAAFGEEPWTAPEGDGFCNSQEKFWMKTESFESEKKKTDLTTLSLCRSLWYPWANYNIPPRGYLAPGLECSYSSSPSRVCTPFLLFLKILNVRDKAS